ncbi:MAG: hypothetical protein ACOX4N_03215 [Dethiobacteraceae bacterium]|nr:hypothetical protein [Bacillota bacterium]
MLMELMPLITLFFLAFPEGMLTSAVGLTLINFRPHWQGAVRVGITHMLAAFFLRRLLPPGIHTLVITIVLVGVIMYSYRLSFKKSFAATILGLVFLVLGESITMPLFTHAFSVTMQDILADPWLRVAASLPTQLFLLLVLLLAYRLRKFHRQPASHWPDRN